MNGVFLKHSMRMKAYSVRQKEAKGPKAVESISLLIRNLGTIWICVWSDRA